MTYCLCVLALMGIAVGADWNYDRCDMAHGPSAWAGACSSGSENSPIDVCGAQSFSLPRLHGENWMTPRTIKIKNNGYTIQVGVFA